MVLMNLSNGKHEKQSQIEDINKMLNDLLRNRAELILLLEKTADELDDVHENVKITKVVTGSTGIVGSLLCVTGLMLTIPTAGLSTILTIGGGALAAASGTAHLSSDIVERILTKSQLDKLNELCQADEINIFQFNDYLKKENEKLQKNSLDEHIFRETASSIVGEILSLSNLTCSVIRVSQATTLTVNSIKIIGNASAVLSVAVLPVQVIDLAANGHALYNKQTSETSVKLRQLAEQLTVQANNIKKFIKYQRLQINNNNQ